MPLSEGLECLFDLIEQATVHCLESVDDRLLLSLLDEHLEGHMLDLVLEFLNFGRLERLSKEALRASIDDDHIYRRPRIYQLRFVSLNFLV